ncbi:PREDICTED: uncharacterized protein LOC104823276 [Tarenaya hassleriana]|uniref:uncharacterized protein LOC104823276 n=1 Tax=Tarenaya hassleriana TaxID=28532 RepID=UPI00053C1964|nr:PREDICTED: uncharacterized protein LOC104823276 [Tarenaya hassleriana]XP_010553066.1 PREDICTED: uncharacterized protein LOC104823276 [Tarenaya hassleriana]
MKLQGLLQWTPSNTIPSLSFINSAIRKTHLSISASLAEQNHQLTARERRRLRNERRESKSGYSWREEVEERLIKKPKKRYASWTEELNLDNLALLGPQWWVVRVSRVRGQETAQVLARVLARNFPDIEFTVYAPAVHVKRILKNGTLSIKPKPIFPGCVFFRCVLNKEIHDFVRECDGVGGFVGSKVGNTKKQINKPRPVDDSDMEAIFKQAKEEQEKADREFEEQEGSNLLTPRDELMRPDSDRSGTLEESIEDPKPKQKLRKASTSNSSALSSGTKDTKGKKRLSTGCAVKVVSGTFAEFVGSLKKMNRKTGKATVGFTLFGKETLVEVDIHEIVPETL